MTKENTTDQIITAFDDVVAFLWGRRREYVNRHDEKYAQEWLERGATLTLCTIVFTRQLEKIFIDEKDMPTSIGYVGDDVLAAIDKMNGKVVDEWERRVSRWRLRVRGFKEKGLWYDAWGDKPPHNPLIPDDVLKEFGWPLRGLGKQE